MLPVMTFLPTIAVSVVYCFWNAYHLAQARKERLLRERVTYLLWRAADVDSDEAA